MKTKKTKEDKRLREKAAITLIVSLDKRYKKIVACPEPDLDALRCLAGEYVEHRMPLRAGQILYEVNRMMECRKHLHCAQAQVSVLNSGIIGYNSTGYGGTDETNLPVCIDIGIPADGLRANSPEVCPTP